MVLGKTTYSSNKTSTNLNTSHMNYLTKFLNKPKVKKIETPQEKITPLKPKMLARLDFDKIERYNSVSRPERLIIPSLEGDQSTGDHTTKVNEHTFRAVTTTVNSRRTPIFSERDSFLVTNRDKKSHRWGSELNTEPSVFNIISQMKQESRKPISPTLVDLNDLKA